MGNVSGNADGRMSSLLEPRTPALDAGRPVSGGRAPHDPVAPIDLVSRIQRIEGDLSPAERRVADAVAADYEATTRMTIGDLANRAGVSQPSVTRFCRSVGCASFGEFKVRLATTLTVAAVYLRTDRVFDDDIGQLAQVVMIRAANTIRDCLEQLDTAAVGRAIAAIASCAGSTSTVRAADRRASPRTRSCASSGLACPFAPTPTVISNACRRRRCGRRTSLSRSRTAAGRSPSSVRSRSRVPMARRPLRSTRPDTPLADGGGDRHSRRRSRRRQRADAYRLALRAHGGDRHDRDRRCLRDGRALARSRFAACAIRSRASASPFRRRRRIQRR